MSAPVQLQCGVAELPRQKLCELEQPYCAPEPHKSRMCGLITPGPPFPYLFKFWGVQLPLRQNASTQPSGNTLRRAVFSSSRSFCFPGPKRTRISTETRNYGFGQWPELWQTTSKFSLCNMLPLFSNWTTSSIHSQEKQVHSQRLPGSKKQTWGCDLREILSFWETHGKSAPSHTRGNLVSPFDNSHQTRTLGNCFKSRENNFLKNHLSLKRSIASVCSQ